MAIASNPATDAGGFEYGLGSDHNASHAQIAERYRKASRRLAVLEDTATLRIGMPHGGTSPPVRRGSLQATPEPPGAAEPGPSMR